MSAQVGTLQQQTRTGNALWPVLVIGLVAALTIGVLATTIDGDGGRTSGRSEVAANTPSEINAAVPVTSVAAGAFANTPSELNAARLGAAAVVPDTSANTPSEMRAISTGGDPNRFADRPRSPAGFHPLP